MTTWRRDPPADVLRAALHVQWTAGADHGAQLGVRVYRTDPRDLRDLLARGASSAALLETSSQALAINV